MDPMGHCPTRHEGSQGLGGRRLSFLTQLPAQLQEMGIFFRSQALEDVGPQGVVKKAVVGGKAADVRIVVDGINGFQPIEPLIQAVDGIDAHARGRGPDRFRRL